MLQSHKRTFSVFVLLIICLFILPHGISAQAGAIPVNTAVSGKYIFRRGDNQLLLLDTFTGNWQLLAGNDTTIGSAAWNSTGEAIAYLDGIRASTILYPSTGEQQTIDVFPDRLNYFFHPQDWSVSDEQILYIGTYARIPQDARDTLDLFDVNTGLLANLLSYEVGMPLNVPLPPLPPEVTGLTFEQIWRVDWNPVYSDWMILQLKGFTSDITLAEMGTGTTFDVNLVYNYQTGQMLSLDQLVSGRSSSMPVTWSPDGTQLALSTSDGLTEYTWIIGFQQVNNTPILEVVDSAESNTTVVSWLGVSDLLLTRTIASNGDRVFYIGQIINGEWYAVESFRLPVNEFVRIGYGDWLLTAEEDERMMLSCLFDQTLVTHLEIGSMAQVAFTDGTSSRLRQMPTTGSQEIALMPEGTSFLVLDGAICADGYRWWQLQLDDGTVGWAAESSAEAYFLEPAA
jgi:hypothetical protein